MYTTIRNIVLALCIGSIVAVFINMKAGPEYRNAGSGARISRQEYESASMSGNAIPVFNRTALALGFFVFSAMFIVKPIKAKV